MQVRLICVIVGALLGYVIDIVIGAVMEMDVIDNKMKGRVLRAFNKVLWIQNDLFARHYLADGGVRSHDTLSSEGSSEGVVEGGKCPFAG